ncbi:MAG: aspartate ammonia-lyase [Syntrophorhabdaceae bacterium]|nr:aspartate ammonia-lyase [Syntrophorhabdaceae bacterium]MDD4197325.1 aspartate ammonia-lyase [Syntrophorhabdaceae bacterium]
MSDNFRKEHDLLGEREVPANAYYGVQTLRATENFHISGIPLATYSAFIRSLAYVKKAAAAANRELGLLPPAVADAISSACDEILDGKFRDQFVVDMIQGGAGTSTNMNANEVIANIALEKLGYDKGRYDIIHPNNHVNLCQSTNDVYPTAIRLTLILKIRQLMDAMEYLRAAFEKKSSEFYDVIKMGRTQLQDAVPMTLGQEFSAYAVMLGEDIERVDEAQTLVREINLGATAIGTGINAHPDYAPLVAQKLRAITGIDVLTSPNLVEATQDSGVYVQLSGVLKRVAVKISKICNDLRLLSSGPRCGLNEINLPPMAPGSTIMPGKVNPIIPEVVNQVAYAVIGNDVTVSFAAEAGQLELNVMEPVIAFSLFNSLVILRRASVTLADRCVRGITANRDRCREYVEHSIGLVTALNPYLGYERCTEIANEALETKRSVCDIVLEKGYMKKEEIDEILSAENMVKPRWTGNR